MNAYRDHGEGEGLGWVPPFKVISEETQVYENLEIRIGYLERMGESGKSVPDR